MPYSLNDLLKAGASLTRLKYELWAIRHLETECGEVGEVIQTLRDRVRQEILTSFEGDE